MFLGRALIQSANITNDHRVRIMGSDDHQPLTRGAIISATGDQKHVLPAIESQPRTSMWLPVPRNMPSKALQNTKFTYLGENIADITDSYVARDSEEKNESDSFLDDAIFIELVKALIPYQHAVRNSKESIPVTYTDALDEPEASIFQSIKECLPGKTREADQLHEKFVFHCCMVRWYH